jgi:hypothetical protein
MQHVWHQYGAGSKAAWAQAMQAAPTSQADEPSNRFDITSLLQLDPAITAWPKIGSACPYPTHIVKGLTSKVPMAIPSGPLQPTSELPRVM